MVEFEIGSPYPQNEDYRDLETARSFWRASYRSGRKYKSARDADGRAVLVRFQRELDDDYEARKQLTPPPFYVGPVIRRYTDFVFRKTPVTPDVEPESVYAMLSSDIDGNGMSAIDFFRERLRRAQIEEVSYILWQSNKPLDAANASAAADQAAGHRIIAAPVNANAVPYYEYDGNALAVCIVLMDVEGTLVARKYDSEYYQDATLASNDDGEQIVSSVTAPAKHGFAGMPVVPLRPVLDDESESQAAPLSELQKSVYNDSSLLKVEIRDNTYTQWVFSGVSAEDMKSGALENGTKRILGLANPGASVSRIGSDVAQATSIRQSISDGIADLYRVAGVDPGTPGQTAAPESGVARAFKFNDLDANLSAMADATEMAFNRSMMLVYATLGQDYPGDADFGDDFSPPEYSQELSDLIAAMAARGLPQIVSQKISDRFVDRNLTLNDDERETYTDQRDLIGINPITLLGTDGMQS